MLSDVEILGPSGHLPVVGETEIRPLADDQIILWTTCTCAHPDHLWSLIVGVTYSHTWAFSGDQHWWQQQAQLAYARR